MVSKPGIFVGDVLCMFIERSLINSGLDKVTAKALAKSACKNIARPVVGAIDEAGVSTLQKIDEKRKSRKASANDRKQSRALRQANSELRNKNGKLKKGKTQKDVMDRAHRIRRRMK